MREEAEKLLQALAEYAGADALRLDDNDFACCLFGGKLTMFAYSGDFDELVVSAVLFPLAKGGGRREMIRRIMQGNYAWAETGGGIMGYSGEMGYVCLGNRFELDRITEPVFLERMDAMFATIEKWSGAFAEETESGATPANRGVIWP